MVKHPDSEKDVWWGPVNFPMDEHGFQLNRERAIDYLNTTRAALRRRRLRRLGSAASAEDPRHLLAAVSRALHAHDAHPPDDGGTRERSASRTT